MDVKEGNNPFRPGIARLYPIQPVAADGEQDADLAVIWKRRRMPLREFIWLGGFYTGFEVLVPHAVMVGAAITQVAQT